VSHKQPIYRSLFVVILLLQTMLPLAAAKAEDNGSRHLDFTAAKLGKFSAQLKKSGKKWACEITTSSGYADLDSKACDGMVKCAGAMESEFYGKKADAWVRRDPQGYQAEFSKVFSQCVGESRIPLIAEYKARKHAGQ
jgi:hypothetical protein